MVVLGYFSSGPLSEASDVAFALNKKNRNARWQDFNSQSCQRCHTLWLLLLQQVLHCSNLVSHSLQRHHLASSVIPIKFISSRSLQKCKARKKPFHPQMNFLCIPPIERFWSKLWRRKAKSRHCISQSCLISICKNFLAHRNGWQAYFGIPSLTV